VLKPQKRQAGYSGTFLPVIQAIQTQRQDGVQVQPELYSEFEANLGYIVRSCLKKKGNSVLRNDLPCDVENSNGKRHI
jgi:hypothetical protein